MPVAVAEACRVYLINSGLKARKRSLKLVASVVLDACRLPPLRVDHDAVVEDGSKEKKE